MFHYSTTIHHRRTEFSLPGKGHRLVHLNWLATKKLQAAQVWEGVRGPRKLASLYFKPITWPAGKVAGATVKGLNAASDGLEFSTYTLKEGAKGVAEMTVKPVAQLAWSRLVALKRTLWDTGWASFKAVLKTPFALATSPIQAALGVRDAVKGVFNSGREMLSSVFQGKLRETIGHSRNAVSSLMQPIVRPTKSVLAPLANAVGTAFGAQWQTVTTMRHAITETIPGGYHRVRNAPNVAAQELAVAKAERAARKAVIEEEKEARKQAFKSKVAAEMGEDVPGGGGQAKAA